MTFDSQAIETVVGLAVLKRTSRTTLAISVYPDGLLELVAPMDAMINAILVKVEKRRKWILTQRRGFDTMHAVGPAPRFVTGATHRYLGRQYRLKVSKGTDPGVSLKGAFFHVTTTTDEPAEVRKLLGKWFRGKAVEQFVRRVDAWIPWSEKHRLPRPSMKLLKMRRRWGSAGADGRISLNPELVHMPSRCIDYVVIHEICHLRHPNHGPQFQRLLTSLMPDWRSVKERLERTEA